MKNQDPTVPRNQGSSASGTPSNKQEIIGAFPRGQQGWEFNLESRECVPKWRGIFGEEAGLGANNQDSTGDWIGSGMQEKETPPNLIIGEVLLTEEVRPGNGVRAIGMAGFSVPSIRTRRSELSPGGLEGTPIQYRAPLSSRDGQTGGDETRMSSPIYSVRDMSVATWW
ncbi:hypothetical protein U1Q18_045688 [Sarracenia purpurea var. burkii]